MLAKAFREVWRKEDRGSATRLREMVEVLRAHDIVHGITPEKLRLILEDLGPTFVKLGQIMSMRPDFLPQEYCDELMKLQTEANPLPFSVIEKVIEQEYQQRWMRIFRSIDEESLGSASIAQVHRAV
uniref:AarF/UbiB family protein n=1 Tax=uncultured Selenomonas sp. TaxID=159275 RepID=UPI0028DD1D20